jgi:hypothetical protein
MLWERDAQMSGALGGTPVDAVMPGSSQDPCSRHQQQQQQLGEQVIAGARQAGARGTSAGTAPQQQTRCVRVQNVTLCTTMA